MDKLSDCTENTEFSLKDHYKERISFHMKMLRYYLDEKYRLGA